VRLGVFALAEVRRLPLSTTGSERSSAGRLKSASEKSFSFGVPMACASMPWIREPCEK